MTPCLRPGSVIAIWGASAQVRQGLADALVQRFMQRGIPSMRLSCAATRFAAGALPAFETWLAKAKRFRQQIDSACKHALVITDRSPLALLAEGGAAAAAWPAELVAAERGHAFTLLIPAADTANAEEQAIEVRLRAAFTVSGQPCTIIHGRDAEQRFGRAWSALQPGPDVLEAAPASQQRLRSRAWNCERCSDPDCEHQLFTELLAARQAPPAG